MKGVLLAGGTGSRLGELTRVTNKHLLPVGPRPMICHPLQKMVEAGVTDICLVVGREHCGAFIELLGSGKEHGCNLTYRVQDEPGGIAQALGLAEGFCAGEQLLVILGDNVFEHELDLWATDKAWLNLKLVNDPGRFGIASLDGPRIVNIREKPEWPKNIRAHIVTGIYVYPPDVFDVIKTLKPSQRGELEITDVNLHYLKAGRLGYTVLNGWWTDAGTPESYAQANYLMQGNSPKFPKPGQNP